MELGNGVRDGSEKGVKIYGVERGVTSLGRFPSNGDVVRKGIQGEEEEKFTLPPSP
jgi:hypothetical protein